MRITDRLNLVKSWVSYHYGISLGKSLGYRDTKSPPGSPSTQITHLTSEALFLTVLYTRPSARQKMYKGRPKRRLTDDNKGLDCSVAECVCVWAGAQPVTEPHRELLCCHLWFSTFSNEDHCGRSWGNFFGLFV